MSSFTYFLQPENGGPIKIGRSAHPLWRLKEIQPSSPLKLRLVAAIDVPGLEKELHSRFKNDRLHGEWFKPSPKLRALIESYGLPDELGPKISVAALEARARNKREYKSHKWK